MGFPWAEAIGGVANLGSSAVSAYFSWKHQKEVMQNRHQWEVADMRKAGLNPILSATGGSGAGGNAPTIVAPDLAGAFKSGAETSTQHSEKSLKDALEKQTYVQNSALQADAGLKRAQAVASDSSSNLMWSQTKGQEIANKIQEENLKQAKFMTQNSALATEKQKMVFDYMRDHPSAWKFGQFMQLLNPFGTSAPVVNSAVGAARLAK
nr:MAG TPA: DNA pilot protein [Microviridae sp.]